MTKNVLSEDGIKNLKGLTTISEITEEKYGLLREKKRKMVERLYVYIQTSWYFS